MEQRDPEEMMSKKPTTTDQRRTEKESYNKERQHQTRKTALENTIKRLQSELTRMAESDDVREEVAPYPTEILGIPMNRNPLTQYDSQIAENKATESDANTNHQTENRGLRAQQDNRQMDTWTKVTTNKGKGKKAKGPHYPQNPANKGKGAYNKTSQNRFHALQEPDTPTGKGHKGKTNRNKGKNRGKAKKEKIQ